MPRSQISGASTIFRGKPTADSWRPAKCPHKAIPNIFARSHINCCLRTDGFQIQKKVITSVKEVMFLLRLVCLFVCVSVCHQVSVCLCVIKITQKVTDQFLPKF